MILDVDDDASRAASQRHVEEGERYVDIPCASGHEITRRDQDAIRCGAPRLDYPAPIGLDPPERNRRPFPAVLMAT